MLSRVVRTKSTGLGFSPRTIAGLQLWLDAADESTLGSVYTGPGSSANNGPIKYWGDKSGNGYHAVRNAADSATPTLLQKNRNGLSVVYFDGGDWLRTSAFRAFPSKRGQMFAAINNRKTSGYGTICANSQSPSSSTTDCDWQWMITTSGTAYSWYQGGGGINKSISDYNALAWQIMSVRRDGDQSLVSRTNGKNDNMSGTLSNKQFGSAPCDIGSYNGGELGIFDLGELIIYTRDLSDLERNAVERYLASKWGVAF